MNAFVITKSYKSIFRCIELRIVKRDITENIC